jgi:NAD(P)-dependent dehydrogenase (short-subunit alcohol dehydrogenase family)
VPEAESRTNPTDLFSLHDQVVVVTGAGSGIGRAIAEGCAASGATVVCADRNPESAEETISQIRPLGAPAQAVFVDVADEESVEALFATVLDSYGRVDVVFCNAGTADTFKRVDEMPLAEWEEILAVNLTGVFLCAKHAARPMVAAQQGKIILTASIWGEFGAKLVPAPGYAAAKGAVVNLTRELALELIPFGITVNAISPGFFSTNLGRDRDAPADLLERLLVGAVEMSPLRRLADPAEIQGTAIYLASAASNLVNGHVLTVDGGYTAY